MVVRGELAPNMPGPKALDGAVTGLAVVDSKVGQRGEPWAAHASARSGVEEGAAGVQPARRSTAASVPFPSVGHFEGGTNASRSARVVQIPMHLGVSSNVVCSWRRRYGTRRGARSARVHCASGLEPSQLKPIR